MVNKDYEITITICDTKTGDVIHSITEERDTINQISNLLIQQSNKVKQLSINQNQNNNGR